MVCYGPRLTTIAGASAVAYVLLHSVIGRILHIVGLVMEVTLITCAVAAAAALLTWTVRSVQRRRAAAGACTTCRFRCQRPVTLAVGLRTPRAVRPRPTILPTALSIARAVRPRPAALPVDLPMPTVMRARPVAEPDRQPEASELVLRCR